MSEGETIMWYYTAGKITAALTISAFASKEESDKEKITAAIMSGDALTIRDTLLELAERNPVIMEAKGLDVDLAAIARFEIDDEPENIQLGMMHYMMHYTPIDDVMTIPEAGDIWNRHRSTVLRAKFPERTRKKGIVSLEGMAALYGSPQKGGCEDDDTD